MRSRKIPFGRIVWLAVWLGWVGFGYWLYANLPRNYLVLRKLPISGHVTDVGFLHHSTLVAFNAARTDVPPWNFRDYSVFDATNGARHAEMRREFHPNFIFYHLPIENGVIVDSLPDDPKTWPQRWNLRVAELRTGATQAIPDVAITRGYEQASWHRSMRWIGLRYRDRGGPPQTPTRTLAIVYDLDAKRTLFRADRADADDPTAYFASAPIFVDDARRFATLVRSSKYTHGKLTFWESPVYGAARPYRTLDLPPDFLDARLGQMRIAADERRIVWTPRNSVQIFDMERLEYVFRSPPLERSQACTISDDLESVIDLDRRQVLDARTGAVRREWPADERFVWHDGRNRCWYSSLESVKNMIAWNDKLPGFLRGLQMPEEIVTVRDLRTGRLLHRAFSPWDDFKMDHGFKSDYIGRRLVDDSGRYMVLPDGSVLAAEPRPPWGLIAAAQAIVATPLVLVWIFRRWRRSRVR